jgi:sulfur-oxidizing protein SoxA
MRSTRLLAIVVGLASTAADDPRRSGYDFMSPATQAMQRDDMATPACCG